MKVSLHIQPILGKNLTGIGVYTLNIVKHITSLQGGNLFFLNLYDVDSTENIRADLSKKGIKLGDDCKLVHSSLKRPWGLQKFLNWIRGVPYSKYFPAEIDISHFFNFVLPRGVKGQSITTVHDMVYKICPETMHWKTRIILELTLKASVKRASRIATVSINSMNDIVRLLHIDPNKVFVTYPAADISIFNTMYTEEEIQECKIAYNIQHPYYLFTGTLEPRKNIVRLIKAYFYSSKTSTYPVKLVLCGKKGWKYKDIFSTIERLQLQNDVIITGYTSTGDIAKLMNGALAFVFPSLYEGFGIPPLEAMCCGAPVITSNKSSLPEVVGDAAILIDPESIEEMAHALSLVRDNEELRQKMRQKGLQQAKQFSWEKTANIIMETYKSMVKL